MEQEKFCKFCGTPLNEKEQCPNNHVFKKMCLNCGYLATIDGNMVCSNTENMEFARKRVIEAAKEAAAGYSITTLNIDLSPLPLKKPTAKCKEWVLSDLVLTTIKNSFE